MAPKKDSYDQVVIGTGSSAVQFLYAAFRGSQTRFRSASTLVVGKSDRWKKKAAFTGKHASHAMGQTGALLRLGDEAPRKEPANPRFIESRDFTNQSNELLEKIKTERGAGLEFEDDEVEWIDGKAPEYTIKLKGLSQAVKAMQVIVACGLGTPTKLAMLENDNVIHSERLAEGRLLYQEIVDAERYVLTQGIEGNKVLIYGGSATASWAAAHAYLYKPSALVWMCRQGEKQVLSDGNPIDRNTEVIKKALQDNIIRQGEIKKVEVIDPPLSSTARLKVTFDKLDKQVYGGNDFVFDQIVYATGSSITAPGGPGGILRSGIRKDLEPRWDNNYRYGADPHDRVVTAYATKDGGLWVIGAAVHHFTNWEAVNALTNSGGKMVNALAGKYCKVCDILPRGGKPPEGIAILTSTINATTGYNWRSGPKGERDATKFNWTKADRREIFQFLAEIYGVDIPLSVRERLVDDIVAERKKTPVGLKKSQIEAIFLKIGGAQAASPRPYGSAPERRMIPSVARQPNFPVRSSTWIDLSKLKLSQNPTVYADDAKSPHEYLDKQFGV